MCVPQTYIVLAAALTVAVCCGWWVSKRVRQWIRGAKNTADASSAVDDYDLESGNDIITVEFATFDVESVEVGLVSTEEDDVESGRATNSTDGSSLNEEGTQVGGRGLACCCLRDVLAFGLCGARSFDAPTSASALS